MRNPIQRKYAAEAAPGESGKNALPLTIDGQSFEEELCRYATGRKSLPCPS